MFEIELYQFGKDEREEGWGLLYIGTERDNWAENTLEKVGFRVC